MGTLASGTINTPDSTRAWLDQAIADAPYSFHERPLLGLDQLDLKNANAAALINAMADIIESTCSRTAASTKAA